LAEARGHRPLPDVMTIQDLKSQAMMRLVSGELDDLIQSSLARIQSKMFTLSIYFGRNLTRRYDRLCLQLFNMFRSPLLRAQFAKEKERWQLKSISTIATSEIPPSHREFIAAVADRKSTRLNSSHVKTSYAVFCAKNKRRTRTCPL